MTLINRELAYIFRQGEMRGNILALLRYFGLLASVILIFSVIFQLIMVQVEGQSHTWFTSIYWTLTTMSTLGYGDVIFLSDIGRFFSVFVLISGVVLVLVVLPFTFIRSIYAPWLEAQLRFKAPRELSSETNDHVIISRHDEIADSLIERLQASDIPHYVIEPDPAVAAHLMSEGVPIVTGEFDNKATFENWQIQNARLLLANREDTTNTNIVLTVREISSQVPIVGIVDHEDSIDILELSGCTHVLPLKVRLGEYLANRASEGSNSPDVIGTTKGLQIAEFSAKHTQFSGGAVRDSGLREQMGLNVVGIWQRGLLQPAFPDTEITDDTILVVVGTPTQVDLLNKLLETPRQSEESLTLIIGAGTVGNACTRALKNKGHLVHILERDENMLERGKSVADQVYIGDANDRESLMKAGLESAQSVILTSKDDAVNVYLAVYCRRLKPDLRIASRITHNRNLAAIHRAGADFALSYSSLCAEAVMSLIEGHDLVMLGGDVEMFTVPLPSSLNNKTLSESGIGSRTGLSVVAIEQDSQIVTTLHASMKLEAGINLIMLGTAQQRRTFTETFS
jgi:Trk K+ transport system NAD-binding subunit